jgi:hypothetical protein
MNRDELLETLKHGSLDRDTKLMIIDLLSLCDDPALEEDINQLVLDWHKADNAITTALLHKFDEIKNKHEEKEHAVEKHAQKDAVQLADDFSREQQIQKVRAFIETL